MEVHIFVWSTMSPCATAANLNELGFRFDTSPGMIQRFHWTRSQQDAFRVSLWVATVHPLVVGLADAILPYMDACVCWYHDHDAMSCLRVRETMRCMEPLTDSIWLMVTTFPRALIPHASRVPRFYDVNGFERTRLMEDVSTNLKRILSAHLCQTRQPR